MCTTNKRPTLSPKSMRKRLPEELERYIERCQAPPDAKKSNERRLPNVAGFCRYLGLGTEELEHLTECDPALYGRITAVLEDELLNFSPSPAILGHYLKRRLHYGAEEKEKTAADCGAVQLIFEHDIEEDGA